jgi:hypothetical protein
VLRYRPARPRHSSPTPGTAALGPEFHPDYGPVLRAVLFIHDRHQARQITNVLTGPARGESRGGSDPVG